jgi:hypothetical protein
MISSEGLLKFSLKKKAKMKKKNDTNLGFSLKREAKMKAKMIKRMIPI